MPVCQTTAETRWFRLGRWLLHYDEILRQCQQHRQTIAIVVALHQGPEAHAESFETGRRLCQFQHPSVVFRTTLRRPEKGVMFSCFISLAIIRDLPPDGSLGQWRSGRQAPLPLRRLRSNGAISCWFSVPGRACRASPGRRR